MSTHTRERVKVCGITRRVDAEAAMDLGADFLGFNFYPKSPRYVPPAQVRSILADLPEAAPAVGIFVNAGREQILRVRDEAGLALVQLHGDETLEFCHALELPVIKAFRVSNPADLEGIETCQTWAVLIDSRTQAYGGSGLTTDWRLAAEAMARLSPEDPSGPAGRLFLAGGLNPQNVADAIRRVRPWAVDVASGIEREPGVKDIDKMKRFFDAVREST